VTGSFQDQIEVLCGLEQLVEDNVMTEFEVIFVYVQMIKDAVMTFFKVEYGLETCVRKLSGPL
jgi:hypothetical protein